MVGIRPEMLRTSVRADADEVRNLSARLQEKLSEQKRFRVETTVGTHLDVRLDPSRPWVVHDGRLRERGWVELPCGEVFTSPASVSGVLVPDGGFWLPDGTASPPTVRLRLRFEGGELARVEGVDAAAAQTLLDQLDSVPEGRRVGRVCFGTNTGVLAATGARLQDTKMPGFHLVLGDPIAELTAAPWQCESEAFVLARRADVVAAGGPLLVRGRYTHALRP
jgi:leucyl aminopeptidase (aminopeptidase T)